jgi:hypothetical protein
MKGTSVVIRQVESRERWLAMQVSKPGAINRVVRPTAINIAGESVEDSHLFLHFFARNPVVASIFPNPKKYPKDLIFASPCHAERI